LRNRSFSTSLREVPLVENDNMSINPEPPSEPPSPIEGRHKLMIHYLSLSVHHFLFHFHDFHQFHVHQSQLVLL
jgi:hypothetical protein